MPTLWNADQRFIDSYLEHFPGYYKTGDAGYIDEDGYVYVMARTDDIINVAGHRLSTGGMEEVLAAHPDVAECAVIGVHDADEGPGAARLPGAQGRRQPAARGDRQGGRAAGARPHRPGRRRSRPRPWSQRLPKTRSGKILRGTMQKIADSATYKAPATIDDPAILPEIEEALQGVGYAKH